MTMPRLLSVFTTILAAVLFTGCASRFDRDWKQAAAKPASPGSLEGAWTGKWLSYTNGHTGRQRAIVTKTDQGYETRFHANYAWCLGGGYSITLQAQEAGGASRLKGSEDLGKILFWELGEYRYDGVATSQRLFSEYVSPHDGGCWELTRP
jgi:hypothetical protein